MTRQQRRDVRSFDRTLFWFCFVALVLVVVYPVIRLLIEALRQWNWDLLLQGSGLSVMGNTLLLCVASVATSAVVGSGLAFVVTRYRFPGRTALSILAYLPFTLPPLVGVLSFYYLIGRDGFIPRFIEQVFQTEDAVPGGFWLILLVHTYSFYVFYYAMVSTALEQLDRNQIEAARTLGAGRLRVFFRVTLPLLRPALVGASLLTFMSAGASFSAPYFFGGDFPVLSTRIYEARSQFDQPAALTLTLLLAMVAFLGVVLFRSARYASAAGTKGVRVQIKSRSGRVLAGAAAWAAIALLLVPHVVIGWMSLVDHRQWQTELIPTVLTLQNYTALFQDARAFAPIRNSIWMSGVATTAVLLLALPAAYLISRRKVGGRLLNVLVMIPWALPGTVIAMNLIVAFNDPWLPIYNTVWMLPLAYFVRSLPMLTRIIGASMEPFDVQLIEAAQTLGASRWYCFWRIVVPLLGPAIIAGMALVFAICLGEFVSSILLYLPANVPISVQINIEWRTSLGAAFAYSVLLTLIVAGTFALSRFLTGARYFRA